MEKEQQLYKLQIFVNEQWQDHPAGETFLSNYSAKQRAKGRGLEFGTYRAAPVDAFQGGHNAD